MRNRNKYDWSKPFKFVDNKKVFDEIETNEESLIISVVEQPPTAAAAPKKQQIPVPKIQTVPRVTDIKKFARILPNYIRLPPHLNLPFANSYQLSQVDHIFLKSNENRFLFKGKKVLSEAFLRKCIVELEMKAGKDMTLPRSKGWLISIIERDFKELLEMDNLEQFAEIIYNYWKNRREELKFPLLRVLWRPSADEYNHMLAFRPRERDKRSLRRTNRIVQDEIIQELYEEFSLAQKVADRIQLREQLKLKQVQLQLSSFYNQCKNFIPAPQLIADFKTEERVQERQRLKGLQDDLEKYRNRKESLENIKIEDSSAPSVDQKQSVVNFLASIVYEAEQLGISYQRVFYSSNSFVDKPKTIATSAAVYIPQQSMQEVPIQNKPSDELVMSVSLRKFEDKIYRTFQEQEEDTHHIKPCKDYLEYKRRKVDKYYFGSDDEGEVKDLRKIISTSFRKFVQMQQLSKTIPSTGEN